MPSTVYVGGTISGLTGSGLVLTLIDNAGTNNTQTSQTLSVAANTTSFTFSHPIANITAGSSTPDIVSALVSTQPAGQTCAVTNGFGTIVNASPTVAVTCVANTTAPLQGAYQLSASGTVATKWIAFAPDGTFIFADIQYPPSPASGCYGVDYGTYNWNSTSNAFAIPNVLVYLPLAPCGFTNAQGVPDTATRTITKSGTGQNIVLTFTTSTSSVVSTIAPVPVNSSNLIEGAWMFGSGLDQGLLVFLNNGYYLVMSTQADPTTGTGAATGVEYGCYTTSNLTATGATVNYDTSSSCAGAVTTTGVGFVSDSGGVATGSLTFATPNANTLQWILGTYTFSYTRLVPN